MASTGERLTALSGEAQTAAQARKEADSQAIWDAMEAEPGFRERLSDAIQGMDRGLAIPYRPIRRRRKTSLAEY
jgi:hypothetical protein